MKRAILLDEARTAYAGQRWVDAFALLQRADAVSPLAPEDVIRLVWTAGMLDKDAEVLANFERLYELQLAAGKIPEAAYAAFFVGFRSMQLNEMGRAGAWLQRAQRLTEQAGRECAAKGYLQLPVAQKALMAGDNDRSIAAAREALAVGERCGEPDLKGFALSLLGRALVGQGKVDEGVACLDEAMLSVTAQELSPIVTGHVYCHVIETCRQIYAIDRAREWTRALAGWCEAQPQLVQFNGLCRVYRAELMEMDGAWPESVEEARRATSQLARALEPYTGAAAAYQEAEIQRLRGEFGAAEETYRAASRWGWDPQPGLALLRLAQGHGDQAAASIRRLLAGTSGPLDRARLLPAAVEILLAAGARDEAEEACREIEATAAAFSTEVLATIAAHARSSIALANGAMGSAIAGFRMALSTWQKLGAPYLAARVRLQLGHACRGLGDEEGATLEWRAAKSVFASLGAAPDLARVDALLAPARPRPRDGLTARELEVLGMIAAGKTNKAVAAALNLSEKTVDRHVSNIFDKIAVSSRSAATAYAYQNGLV